MEDAKEEEAHRDLCERNLDLVHHGDGLEALRVVRFRVSKSGRGEPTW